MLLILLYLTNFGLIKSISFTNQQNTVESWTAYDQNRSTTLFECKKFNSYSQFNQSLSNLIINENQTGECEYQLSLYNNN